MFGGIDGMALVYRENALQGMYVDLAIRPFVSDFLN
jgi:hypothetical protein